MFGDLLWTVLFVLVVLVCVALAKAAGLARQVVDLRRRNARLESRIDALASIVAASPERRDGGPPVPAAPAPLAPTGWRAPVTPPVVAVPGAGAGHAAGRWGLPRTTTVRSSREWEVLIGEKWLNRLGAVTLILAAGFFLSYAFAHNWIPPVVRVLMGVAAGAGLVGMAGRFRAKLPVFAQGILGAGLSILYLSAYASFGFYRLVPLTVAFAAMAAVTAVVLERALSFDSRAVALLGWIGGFLTPVLLSEDGRSAGSGAGLFLYLFLLTAALVTMAWRRPKWAVLEPLTLLGVYGSYLGWRMLSAPASVNSADVALPLAFLSGVWGVVFTLDLVRAANGTAPAAEQHLWSSANGVLYLLAAYELLTPDLSDWTALLTALMALAYIAPVALLKRQMPAFTLKAISLMAVATALQFDGYPRAVAWSIEAAALVAVGVSLEAAHVRYGALVVMGIGVGAALVMPSTFVQTLTSYRPAASGRSAALALEAAALAVAAWSYHRALASRPPDEAGESGESGMPEGRLVEQALHFGWTAVLLLLTTVEVTDGLRLLHSRGHLGAPGQLGYTTAMVLVPVWTAFGVATGWLARRLRHVGVAGGGLTAMAVASLTAVAAGFQFVPVAAFQPVANLRFLAVGTAVVGCLVHRRLMAADEHKLNAPARRALDVAAGVLVFAGLTGEISDFYRRRLYEIGAGDAGVAAIRSQRQLALSVGWLLYAAVALALGLWKRKRSLRLASIAMLGIAVLKVFAVDLSFLEQGYRILSFLGLGVLLLVASFLYQRHRDIILAGDETGPRPGSSEWQSAPVH
jgi:uncharacterized membrane protein